MVELTRSVKVMWLTDFRIFITDFPPVSYELIRVGRMWRGTNFSLPIYVGYHVAFVVGLIFPLYSYLLENSRLVFKPPICVNIYILL